jgi:hypothetical protein
MAAAFVITRDDVSEPLVARAYARHKTMGCPTLYEAFARLGITPGSSGVKQEFFPGGKTYVLPQDCVLLMIGQTLELVQGCKVAHEDKEDHSIGFIRAEHYRLHLRYARIQVHQLSKQTDTLIALGAEARLPEPSKDGWHELDWWPFSSHFVITEDYSSPTGDYRLSLPVHIKWIKENDSAKWINA